LEAADRLGKKPSIPTKVRKNFTVDEGTFEKFREKCFKNNESMSGVLEEFMSKY